MREALAEVLGMPAKDIWLEEGACQSRYRDHGAR
jgi:hypothetical protein